MKSSFSRNFTTAAAILLLALVILGASFQLQVNGEEPSPLLSFP